MKLNENFILKTVAGMPVVMPVGEAVRDIQGIISLNEIAEIIWKAIEAGKSYEEIIERIKSEYDTPEDIIRKDVDAFLEKLRKHNILE